MIGVPARRGALQLLDAVLRRGERVDSAAPRALGPLARPDDRALALAITGEVLRRLPDLDALIDGATKQRLPDDAKARAVLRIALAQALRLATPPHAAITTVLPLVEGGPKRLVHGVFGTLIRQGATLPEPPALPAAVEQRWRTSWGEAMLLPARDAIAQPPPVDFTLGGADDGGLGGECLLPGHRRLARSGDVATLPGYADGHWWVQNLAASLPARLFGPAEGRSILDLCAAPGGKAMQLATAGWRVTALDASGERLKRVRANLDRTRLDAALVEADVMAWTPPEPPLAILLDAPCTATGIFARHPDVLHRIGPRDIAALAEVQAAMLARALDWLAPGGHLVYATCSVEREEGEGVVERVLCTRPQVALDPIAMPLPEGVAPAPEGWLRILPRPGLDGFFIASLRRR